MSLFQSSINHLLIEGGRIMDEILEILEDDARATPEEIARLTNRDPKAIRRAIRKYEKEGVILKYRTIINKELIRSKDKDVRALIEVNVAPQKDVGFDHIARRIYSFPEVSSCYLVSGTYDLLLVVEGQDIHTVSNFVAEKLAPMENVRGTVTHFLLKKYKEDGVILRHREENKRIAISY
jgi:DNA-binding Lrp family transcriptional regulator